MEENENVNLEDSLEVSTQSDENIKIADDVVASIAGVAVSEVQGV